jgi:hypothetical protein
VICFAPRTAEPERADFILWRTRTAVLCRNRGDPGPCLSVPYRLAVQLDDLVHVQQGLPRQKWNFYLSLTPFSILLADYFDNARVVTMLLSYPCELVTLTRISNIITVVKFVIAPVELLFIVGLIGWLIPAIRDRRRVQIHTKDQLRS